METPNTYYSRTDNEWSVIVGGSPVCKRGSKEEAMAAALHYKLEIEYIWDGNKGEFIDFE